jgi:LacI family transcriptional regulator
MSGTTQQGVTILDIARTAGVSKSTVSLVLKNSPLIKPSTAAKVRAAAQRLGYVYNRGAANLRHGKSNIVGVVVNDLFNPFFVELLIGAEHVLNESGFTLLMAHAAENLATQSKVLVSMREHNAAGIILCPVYDSPGNLPDQILQWGLPLVVVTHRLGELNYDFVGSNNYVGIYQAARYFISRGHRKIAYAGRQGRSYITEQCRNGFLDAMHEHGIDVDEKWVIDVPASTEGGRQGLRALLSLDDRPSAVICYYDHVAIGVLSELDHLGLRAGRDLSVIGYDDIAEAAHTNPPLTTMAINPKRQGELAGRMLLERLNNPTDAPQTAVVDPVLVVRATDSQISPAKPYPKFSSGE